MEIFTAFCVFAAICVSGGVGFYLNKHLNAKRIGDATELATRIVEESRKEAQAACRQPVAQRKSSFRGRTSFSTRSASLSTSSRSASGN